MIFLLILLVTFLVTYFTTKHILVKQPVSVPTSNWTDKNREEVFLFFKNTPLFKCPKSYGSKDAKCIAEKLENNFSYEQTMDIIKNKEFMRPDLIELLSPCKTMQCDTEIFANMHPEMPLGCVKCVVKKVYAIGGDNLGSSALLNDTVKLRSFLDDCVKEKCNISN